MAITMTQWLRVCPECNKTIIYKGTASYVNYTKKKVDKNTLCKSCNGIRLGNANKGKKRTLKQRRVMSLIRRGAGNGFFGKRHSEATKSKMSSAHKGKSTGPNPRKANKGNKNGRWGRSLMDCWTAKYGVEEAKRREALWISRHKPMSGKDNPMYGKPSPKKAGNGWSGWYKGWYFRSLRELSYVIDVLEARGLKWKSAETKKLTIHYTDAEGTPRTYRADFLVNNRTLVEIKPTALHRSQAIILKRRAAKKFCRERGLRYRIYDIDVIPLKRLRHLVRDGLIVLTEAASIRLERYIAKRRKAKARQTC